MSERVCEFCGCRTNARLRMCCNPGHDADRETSSLRARIATLEADLARAEAAADERHAKLVEVADKLHAARADLARVTEQLAIRDRLLERVLTPWVKPAPWAEINALLSRRKSTP